MVLPGVLARGAPRGASGCRARARVHGADELGRLALERGGVGEREVGDAEPLGDLPVEPRHVLARPEERVDPVLQRALPRAARAQLVDDEVRHGDAVGVGAVGARRAAASPARP